MSQTLYQKYRPKNFEEVIGQDFIKEVLIKSIQNKNIQGTYLFSGPRGTGKTSIAKIFAKAVNCESTESNLTDNCQYCQYFESTKNYDDIFELDAASNNGVDDIRSIIENVQYQPIHLKKKVYIIDEVHMLSKGAFNALLKTLEEPQENSIFILATTEPNKIPATILSRCQRLDFGRIPDKTMNKHLKTILEKEDIKYEEEIVPIVTSLSDGCVRDALSLLQKLTMASNNITLEYLQTSLGILKEKQYNEILNYMVNGEISDLLKYWEEIYISGINVENFIIDFQFHLKNLLISKITEYDKVELLNIIYKINDLEQRAIYTKNLNNLIIVYFVDIITSKKDNKSIEKIENTKSSKKSKNEESKEQNKDIEKIENYSDEVDVLIEDYNQPKEEVFEGQKEVQNTKIVKENVTMVSEETCYEVLNCATKESRILYTKEFTKISDELTKKKKHGIAKFFMESQIKAASETELIIVIEQTLVKAYLKRKEELLNNINNITELHIIDEEKWSNVKTLFMKNNQVNKEEKPSKTNEDIDTDDQEVVKKIEDKLKIKIQTVEE